LHDELFKVVVDHFLEMDDKEMKYVYTRMKDNPIVREAYSYCQQLIKGWKHGKVKVLSRTRRKPKD